MPPKRKKTSPNIMASDEKPKWKRKTVPPSPPQSPTPIVEEEDNGGGGSSPESLVILCHNDATRIGETEDNSFIPGFYSDEVSPPPVPRWPLLPDLNGPPPNDFDLTVTAELSQVARRSYPHSRHHCIKFPFDTTPHEEHCELCYCFVCDLAAPCSFWTNELNSHCDAGDFGHWKNQRELKRKFKENKRNKKKK